MRDYTIRRATISDAKNILRVLSLAFEDYKPYYPPEAYLDTVLSPDTISIRLSEMKVFVAVSTEGEIMGTVSWKQVNKNEGHLRGMAVHPDWQGTGGVASKLLERVESEALEAKCTIITLDTTSVLKRAIAFYKKNGYQQSGKISNFFGIPIYEFTKRLQDLPTIQ